MYFSSFDERNFIFSVSCNSRHATTSLRYTRHVSIQPNTVGSAYGRCRVVRTALFSNDSAVYPLIEFSLLHLHIPAHSCDRPQPILCSRINTALDLHCKFANAVKRRRRITNDTIHSLPSHHLIFSKYFQPQRKAYHVQRRRSNNGITQRWRLIGGRYGKAALWHDAEERVSQVCSIVWYFQLPVEREKWFSWN